MQLLFSGRWKIIHDAIAIGDYFTKRVLERIFKSIRILNECDELEKQGKARIWTSSLTNWDNEFIGQYAEACQASGFNYLLELFQKFLSSPSVLSVVGENLSLPPGDHTQICHPEIAASLDPILNALAECLPRSKKANRFVLESISTKLKEYLCKTPLKIRSLIDCAPVILDYQTIQKCRTPFIDVSVAISNLNIEECKALNDTRVCLSSLLSTCGGDDIQNLIDGVTDTIRNDNDCEQKENIPNCSVHVPHFFVQFSQLFRKCLNPRTIYSMNCMNVTSCFAPMFEVLAECLPEKTSTNRQMISNLARKLTALACTSSLQGVLNPFRPLERAEMFTAMDWFEECSSQFDIVKVGISHLGATECRALYSIKNCYERQLKSSGEEEEDNWTIQLYNAIYNSNQCDLQLNTNLSGAGRNCYLTCLTVLVIVSLSFRIVSLSIGM